MRTNVYIDGFNLFYGCLKGSPYKWLNIEALCRRLLPKDQINRIRYGEPRRRPHLGRRSITAAMADCGR